MATPPEKLAQSLELLHKLKAGDGAAAIRARDLPRTHRERLLRNGFLQEVIKGWYIPCRPDEVKGEAVVCFCILKPKIEPSDALRVELKNQVANELGKPLAPHDILFVRDLPRTRNAKIMRRVIRAVYLGKDPGDQWFGRVLYRRISR